MNGLCITDAVKQFGVTSKTLRYYERVGLLESNRVENNYRFYNESEVERIKQILILRKMQISIKDIIRIYENEDMSTVVEVFVSRINSIEDEVGALTELRRITNDFLQAMVNIGITKISAIPLLYEEMNKQLSIMEERKPVTTSELDEVSERLLKHTDFSIITLPPTRMLTSIRKDNNTSETNAFWDYLQKNNLPVGLPGQHELFEYQVDEQTVFMQKIPNDYKNNSPYEDFIFYGGLFAFTNVYADEDLGGQYRSLIRNFDSNKYYQIDYKSDGSLRHESMLESLISPDDQRELVAMLVPVKKRMADPDLFEKPKEVIGITVSEIEAANPILWEINVPLDNLTQTLEKNSYLKINEDGEAEYIGWILRAVLNTHISVKLPFRIDMEFRQSGIGKTGIKFYHGDEIGYYGIGPGNRCFGINNGNNNEKMVQAINFHQPMFWDDYNFPERGATKINEFNRLTWIMGKNHIAVIINDEIRYCGTNFPYMSLDLSCETAEPIMIGTEGNEKIYIRSVRISQIAETKGSKLKKGELSMITKQSNNIIPVIHRLVTDEYGENYWFNGCAKYVMECLGEKDYDYWFFAGLTGDIFTQHYTYTIYSGDAMSSYRMDINPKQFVKDTFNKCGYAATYIPKQELEENTEMYLNTLMAYINKGIPVIAWGKMVGVYVGYEEHGKTLLYITGNNNQPGRISLNEAIGKTDAWVENAKEQGGWIFIGEKKENIPLAQIYKNAIKDIPNHFAIKTNTYCFGAEAFRAWAADIENGKFDNENGKYEKMTSEDFDTWGYYTNYVCVLATNSGCCQGFLKKARVLNSDFAFLEDVGKQYRITGLLWNGQYGKDDTFAVEYVKEHESKIADNLEALGGGFNITLSVLQDKDKRKKIAAKIREFAECMDEILRILQRNN